MKVYIGGLEVKKTAPKQCVPMAIAVEANTAKLAETEILQKLNKEHPETAIFYFKPKICADRVGLPRPPIGEFNADWMTKNAWNAESKIFEPIPLGETNTELAGDTEPSTQQVNLNSLPLDIRIAYIILYGACEFDSDYYSNACDLAIDDECAIPGARQIIDGLSKLPHLKDMPNETIAEIISDINQKYPTVPAWPQIKIFAENWLNSRQADDKPLVIARTLETLDVETALARIGINPIDAKGSDVQKAKAIIKSNDPIWRAWRGSLVSIPNATDIDREVLFEILYSGMQKDELNNKSDLRKDFIFHCLDQANVILSSLDDDEASNEVIATQTTAATEPLPTVTDSTTGQQETTTGALVTNVNITTTVEPETAFDSAQNDIPPTPTPDEFQQRAKEIENAISSGGKIEQENLSIWKMVQRTDPARTKQKHTYGNRRNADGEREILRTVTSINPTYQTMRATAIFGPFGIGWGVDIIEERFDPGLPLMETMFDSTGNQTGLKPMRDGDGTILRMLNHTIVIKLWYEFNNKIGQIYGFGHTKYLYATKNGFTCEDEPSKKSLTDATTKALSALGFSADIYMGMFDDAEYLAENKIEFNIKNASDKADETVRIRKELDEKFKANTATMRSAVTKNEVEKIASSLIREIGIHLDNARAIGDKEYDAFLSGRLHRLETIKKECLDALTKPKSNEKEDQ